LRGFAKHMIAAGFEVRPIFLRPTAAVWNWADGRVWDKTVQAAQMAEGDLAMLVLRTADNLRHVAVLRKEFPQIAECARRAIELILRDPVMPEYPSGIAQTPMEA
jgi:ATP-dependent RNA helicase HelY